MAKTAFPAAGFLFDLTSPEIITKITLKDASATLVEHQGGKALQVDFGHDYNWPHIAFSSATIGYPSDWSGFGYLAITLSNSGNDLTRVNLRVDSTADPGSGRQAGTWVSPGRTIRMIFSLSSADNIIGMCGQPPVTSNLEGDVLINPWNTEFNSKEILSFQIFISKPEKDSSLLLHKVELITSVHNKTEPFVDRYGQYNGAEWPGKIHSDDELRNNIRKEAEYIKANPMLPHYSQYGGWKTGPKQEATGRFQIKKLNGKWWLVDPDGYLFWSSGTTCVRIDGNATIISGREYCFSWLPEKKDPLFRFLTKKSNRLKMDFFLANLYRKYGKDFVAHFNKQSTLRMQAWGMNTIANWSSSGVYKMRKLPYIIPVSAKAPRFVASLFLKNGLTRRETFPDPFDPGYGPTLTENFKTMEGCIGDPWLLGVFVDNELPWLSRVHSEDGPWDRISVNAFCVNGPATYIKQAIVDQLKKSYETTTALNNVWKTDYKSWDEVLEPIVLRRDQINNAEKDMLMLEAFIAERYFRETRDALKQCDPDVLYMGPRFSSNFTSEVVAIASKYCDILSFNIYQILPDMSKVDELAIENDFPVIIGEFHFGALDRGMFHTGLREAVNQEDRAQKYVNYIETAARAPWCVGAHWFQYKDQSLTGRSDGENYNIGFINETDSIYPEMSKSARKVHKALYNQRYHTERSLSEPGLGAHGQSPIVQWPLLISSNRLGFVCSVFRLVMP